MPVEYKLLSMDSKLQTEEQATAEVNISSFTHCRIHHIIQHTTTASTHELHLHSKRAMASTANATGAFRCKNVKNVNKSRSLWPQAICDENQPGSVEAREESEVVLADVGDCFGSKEIR